MASTQFRHRCCGEHMEQTHNKGGAVGSRVDQASDQLGDNTTTVSHATTTSW